MVRNRHSSASDTYNEAYELLGELLCTPVPGGKKTPRRVTLRSVAEQQRVALHSFLCRTWFDHTLKRVERLLIGVLALFFAYWFLDGYGRDWLYSLRLLPQRTPLATTMTSNLSWPSFMNPPFAPEQSVSTSKAAKGTISVAALPFTTPDMEKERPEPDYLAPPLIAAPNDHTDPNPRRLIIPTVHVNTTVKEVFIHDGVWQVADYAAGYHHGSALPGTVGNTVMAAHAGLRGGVFRDLGMLHVGDEIFVETGSWRYRYQVRDLFSVWPTEVGVTEPTSTPVLTLITCAAWDTQRLIVIADLIDSRPLT